jgi:hypothetical protein
MCNVNTTFPEVPKLGSPPAADDFRAGGESAGNTRVPEAHEILLQIQSASLDLLSSLPASQDLRTMTRESEFLAIQAGPAGGCCLLVTRNKWAIDWKVHGSTDHVCGYPRILLSH